MMDLAEHLFERWNYLAVIILMMIGLYITISRGNLVKKVMGMTPGAYRKQTQPARRIEVF